MNLTFVKRRRLSVLIAAYVVAIGSWSLSSLALDSGSVSSVDTLIRDICVEMNIDVTPEQAETWKDEVTNRIKAVETEISSGYPIPATRDALTNGCILGLRNKPGAEYRFYKSYSPSVADLEDLNTGERHLVNVSGMSKGVFILKDFMKETTLLVKEAHNALDRLQKHGAGIRDFVDRVVSGTAATYGFLEKSVSSENLEELRENEAKATAEIQKAKQVLDLLTANDEVIVKSVAEVEILLTKAQASLKQVGPDGVTLEKELDRLRMLLQHLRASSGMETRFNQDYVTRAKAAFDELTEAYRQGMEGVRMQRAILQQAQESNLERENVAKCLSKVDETFKQIGHTANQVAMSPDAGALVEKLEGLTSSLTQLESAVKEAEDAISRLKECNEGLEQRARAVVNKSRQALAARLLGDARDQERTLQKRIEDRISEIPDTIKLAVTAVGQAVEKELAGLQPSVDASTQWLEQKAKPKLLSDFRSAVTRARSAESAANEASLKLTTLLGEAQKQVECRVATFEELENTLGISSALGEVKNLRHEALSLISLLEEKLKALENGVKLSQTQGDVLKGTLKTSARNLTQLATRGEELRASVEAVLSSFGFNAEESRVQVADVNRTAGKALTTAKNITVLADQIKAGEEQLQSASSSSRATVEEMKRRLLGMGRTDRVGEHIKRLNERAAAFASAIASLKEGVGEAQGMENSFQNAYTAFQRESKSFRTGLDSSPDVLRDDNTGSIQDDVDNEDTATQHTRQSHKPGVASHSVAFDSSVAGVLNLADALFKKLESAKNLRENAGRAAILHKLALMAVEALSPAPDDSEEVARAVSTGQKMQVEFGKLLAEAQRVLDDLDLGGGGSGGIDATASEVLVELTHATREANALLEKGLLMGIPYFEMQLLEANKLAETIKSIKTKGTDEQTAYLEDELLRKDKACRAAAQKLKMFVASVVTVSRKILSSLKRLESFCEKHNVNLKLKPSGLRLRRLASSASAALDAIRSLKVEATELEAKALDAATEVEQRLTMLSSLLRPDDGAVPGQGPVPSAPDTSTSTTTAKPTHEEEKKEGIDQKALYAVCIASGALLLLGLLCGAKYAYKHHQALKNSDSNASTLDVEGSLPTRDFDPRGPFASRPSLENEAAQELNALSQSINITPVVTEENEVNCSDEGKTDIALTPTEQSQVGTESNIQTPSTTKKQYMVDEHHLVARGVGVEFLPSPLATPRGGPLDLSEDVREINLNSTDMRGSSTAKRPHDEMRRRREFEELTQEVEKELSGKRFS